MTGFEVRDAVRDEAEEVLHVKNASWRAAYRGLLPDAYLAALTVTPGQVEHWQRLIGDRRVIVGEAEGRIAGLSAFGPAEDGAEIYAIYVLPEHWSTGLGAALMTRSLRRLRELGYDTAGLWVFEANPRARRFYERMGFTLSGRTEIEEREGFAEPVVHYHRTIISP